MRQRLENISQETRDPQDLLALDERVRSYTHLASRNGYLALIISLSWAALYYAITLNSGRLLMVVTFPISTSILLLFARKVWLTRLKTIDERARLLIMSSYSWMSLYVAGCACAILLYFRFYVESSDFFFSTSYLLLAIFLSIATNNATLVIMRAEYTGTYHAFWVFVLSGVFFSLMELTTFIKLVEYSKVSPKLMFLHPIVGFLAGAVSLAIMVARHHRRNNRLENE
jgi:hypothetical protein